jgi:hypothetical protein
VTVKACKHLDHTTEYIDWELKTIPEHEFGTEVKYWERQNIPYEGAAVKDQFCGLGRGRIAGIFQCYNGEMSCYEAQDATND